MTPQTHSMTETVSKATRLALSEGFVAAGVLNGQLFGSPAGIVAAAQITSPPARTRSAPIRSASQPTGIWTSA